MTVRSGAPLWSNFKSTDPNCVLHLDAENYVYTGLNGTWEDLSQQQNHCISTNAPSASINTAGRPALAFNYPNAHVHDYFQTQNNSVFSGLAQFPITVFAVFEQSTHSTFATLVSQNPSDGYDGMCFFSYGNNYDIATDHWQPGGRVGTTNAVQTVDTTYVACWSVPDWRYHQSSSIFYVNGVNCDNTVYNPVDPLTIAPVVADPLIIGNWQIDRDDMDFHGYIEKIIVYNRYFVEDEIIAASRNLMEKYRPDLL